MMKHILFVFIVASFAAAEEPPVPPDASATASQQAENIYERACAERSGGDPKRAIQTVTQVMVQYPDETEWMAKSELLCAELYMDIGMPDAADVTARQIQTLYAGMDIVKDADALRARIKKLKETSE